MIDCKIEQIGDEVGIVFDEHALEFLGVGLGDDLFVEKTEGGLMVQTVSQMGGRRTFDARIEQSPCASSV